VHQLQALGSQHRALMTSHLQALPPDDRCDRFLAAVNDAYVSQYVHSIGFARDILVGIVDGTRLVGMAHAGVSIQDGELVAEVGLSVASQCRRMGLGQRLLQAVVHTAVGRGVQRVEVIFRSGNQAMAALTRRLGGTITRCAGESSAVFRIGHSVAWPLHTLRTLRSARGAEFIQLRHPQERGRALLIHGAGGDSYQWLPELVPALWAAGYSVMAPTLPGHGREADPTAARLEVLQACVSEAADCFEPTLIVGHSMGGYLVQRHLQTRPARRLVLLASLPPLLPGKVELAHRLSQLQCPLAQASARAALVNAPDLEIGGPHAAQVQVIGGEHDRVVPKRWVSKTAKCYGVKAQFVSGGHLLLRGQAAVQAMAFN
jgi:surfactin synthase thioesterase subunit/GNAT superfamily N-acetyltransferase